MTLAWIIVLLLALCWVPLILQVTFDALVGIIQMFKDALH
jgi:hypothetical protein